VGIERRYTAHPTPFVNRELVNREQRSLRTLGVIRKVATLGWHKPSPKGVSPRHGVVKGFYLKVSLAADSLQMQQTLIFH
jgi:hypothetical protein